jgi:prepilin-type N-terminal cleavage/methylation domain-containing protein
MLHVRQKGFSLVELLVVLGMMTVLLSIGGLSFANIRLRSRARTSNGIPSGVYFESGRFVYFEDTAYTEGDPDNDETTLPSSHTFSSITLSGNTAQFDHITGNLEDYTDPSEIVLTDIQTGQSKTISINKWGMIAIQ